MILPNIRIFSSFNQPIDPGAERCLNHCVINMKTLTSVIKVPFDELIEFFTKRSENKFGLDPVIGRGHVQIFELEKGLQARFWDCSFNEEIEMYSNVDSESENSYFTLAFFPNMHGLQFANNGTFLQENIIWDTVFISAASDYKILIVATTRVHCLSISFSKKWLNNNVLKNNEAFKNLKEKIDTTQSFSMFESMSVSEKKMIQELLEASWEKSLGSFCIKSAVLKIICDFFYKLKEKQTFNMNALSPCSSIAEVEKYLCDQLLCPMPNLKDLAYKFSISESTLKRHFKKRYGVNMSTYFIKRKMEYAQQLIDEKNTSFSEIAHLLGYRNVNNFITMFRKHIKA